MHFYVVSCVYGSSVSCVCCDGFCMFCTCLWLLLFVRFGGFMCSFSCLHVLGLQESFGNYFIWVFFGRLHVFQGLVLMFPSGLEFFLLFLGRLVGFSLERGSSGFCMCL